MTMHIKSVLFFMLVIIIIICASSENSVYMLVEYATNGTVVYRTNINATIVVVQTVHLDVTVLGCDTGYYDVYNTLPFVCRECICDAFSDGRNESY